MLSTAECTPPCKFILCFHVRKLAAKSVHFRGQQLPKFISNGRWRWLTDWVSQRAYIMHYAKVKICEEFTISSRLHWKEINKNGVEFTVQ